MKGPLSFFEEIIVRRYISIALTVLALSLFFDTGDLSASPGLKPSGPVSMRNDHPLYLFYLNMSPDTAATLEDRKFKVGIDYSASNTMAKGGGPGQDYDILIDTEVQSLELNIKYGLSDRIEVEAAAPYLAINKGYLDSFISEFEKAFFSAPADVRKDREKHEYGYSVKYKNRYLINTSDASSGLGDIVLSSKFKIVDGRGLNGPALSVKASVKLPTGDKGDFLGSGKFDYGIGFLADKKLLEKLYGYLNINAVLIDKPNALSDLDIESVIYLGVIAFEYMFTDRLSMVTQLVGSTSPYPDDSNTDIMSNEVLGVNVGFNYAFSDNVIWDMSFYENAMQASSADFSLKTGMRRGF